MAEKQSTANDKIDDAVKTNEPCSDVRAKVPNVTNDITEALASGEPRLPGRSRTQTSKMIAYQEEGKARLENRFLKQNENFKSEMRSAKLFLLDQVHASSMEFAESQHNAQVEYEKLCEIFDHVKSKGVPSQKVSDIMDRSTQVYGKYAQVSSRSAELTRSNKDPDMGIRDAMVAEIVDADHTNSIFASVAESVHSIDSETSRSSVLQAEIMIKQAQIENATILAQKEKERDDLKAKLLKQEADNRALQAQKDLETKKLKMKLDEQERQLNLTKQLNEKRLLEQELANARELEKFKS